MELTSIEGWCAGVKVTGLCEYNRPKLEHLDFFVELAVKDYEASCVVASVNTEEEGVINLLKKYGFKKCPWIKNWGHGGRKTCLYVYQIPYKRYIELGGTNWDN